MFGIVTGYFIIAEHRFFSFLVLKAKSSIDYILHCSTLKKMK